MAKILKGFIQTPLIIVKYQKNRGKGGRAVFARKDIEKDSLIEWAPCILVPEKEIGRNFNKNILPWYVFEWHKGKKVMNAIALGYISIYNHSYDSNAFYEMVEPDCIQVWARKNIKKNEEITINYNGDPNDKSEVGFKVNQTKKNKLAPVV